MNSIITTTTFVSSTIVQTSNVEIILVSSDVRTRTTLNELTPVFEWMQPNMAALTRKIKLLSSDTVAGYISVIEFHEDGSIYTLHNRIKTERFDMNT